MTRLLVVAILSLLLGAAWLHPAPEPDPLPLQPQPEGFTLDHHPMGAAATRGRLVYENFCIGCHGDEGLGDGPAARFLDPLPRNFQSGRFKFRSTPSGELPTDEDLLHVITCGLQGASMPGYPLMPDLQKQDVVAYVRHLAEFGLVKREVEYVMEDEELSLQELLDERLQEIYEESLTDAYAEVWPVSVEPQPEMDEDSIAEGRELYEKQCVACHGATGQGDGNSSYHLRDWKDAQVLPRDFTTGVFRAGSTPRDLFLRMRTGVNGTPMPAIYGSDEELWALTHYILSLKDEQAAAHGVHPTSCEARHGRDAEGAR